MTLISLATIIAQLPQYLGHFMPHLRDTKVNVPH